MATLAKEVADMYEIAKLEWEADDGTTLSNRITHFCVLIARSSELLTEAQIMHDEARGHYCAASKDIDPPLSATLYRDWLAGKLAPFNRFLMASREINNTLEKQLEAMRSQLSYVKSEMNMVRQYGNR